MLCVEEVFFCKNLAPGRVYVLSGFVFRFYFIEKGVCFSFVLEVLRDYVGML